jgi:ribosomal protein L35AE/L33A
MKVNNSYQRKFYNNGMILGYKRSLRNQNMSKIRVRISIANDMKEQRKFLGAKIFFIKSKGHKKPKTSWGKIISLHGRSGVFLAKFKKQISPIEITSRVYIVPKNSSKP